MKVIRLKSKGLVLTLIFIAISCMCSSIFADKSHADTIIYGSNAYGSNAIVAVNLTSGFAQMVGNTLFETQAIDQDPQTGYVYYFEWRTTGDEFAYWDPVSQSNTIIRTYEPAPGIYAKQMAFSPDGRLYLLDNSDRLYTVDKITGDLFFEGTVTGLEEGNYGRTGDFAFSPDGTLYLATYKSLYIVDLNTLSATLMYSNMLGEEETDVWTGLAYCNGILFGSNAEEASGLSGIFSIDPETGVVDQLFSSPILLNDLSSCTDFGLDNHPPQLDVIGHKDVTEGELLEFVVTASDPDPGDTLTYNATNVPTGASFDPASGVFSWTPVFGAAGNYVVTFTVTDDGTPVQSDLEDVTITVASTSSPSVITLTGVNNTEDSMIVNGSYSSRNYGGSADNLAIGSIGGNSLRALIKWDFSSIPSGSTIIKAEMSLYCYQDYAGGQITINSHRILQPWVEGNLQNQDRMSANPYSVTWLEYGYGEPWQGPGASGAGDRDPSILDSDTRSGTGWYVWDLTEAVQNWIDGSWLNDGLILVSGNEGGNNMKIFAPSEYPNQDLRPQLVIEYTSP